MRRFWIRSTLGLWVWMIACGGPSPEKPPVIRYGEDACEECKMLISEPRFAAAYGTKENVFRFDDIGCMILHYRKHDGDVQAFWVHDYETGDWISGEKAYFVVGSEVYTPMAYGIVAFEDSLRARALVSRSGGRILRLQELLRSWVPEKQKPGSMPGMKGGHHHE